MYLEVSHIGSACGKNKYEPINKTILLLLARNNPKIVKNLLLKNKIVVETDGSKLYTEELMNIYSEYQTRITESTKLNEIQKEIVDRLKIENKDITGKDISIANNFLESSLKKDCGINNEKSVIKSKLYTKGNNLIHKYVPWLCLPHWELRGFHDASIGDVVIEIKTRMKMINVRKNEYDLYQLFGYLLVMGKTKGKIVQKYMEYIFDSDTETKNEYGLIDITEGKWKTRFELFKKELYSFFEKVDYICEDIESRFDILEQFEISDLPIAVLESGVPKNIKNGYEKILKTLF
tara:strand:+ start:435 stop:1310 length:876 start_codon:yes stop_codon:yes gene_type:complete